MNRKFMFLIVLILGFCFLGVSTSMANCCKAVGTGSPGYWKNHPEAWPNDVTQICIDDTCFSKEEVINIMDSPVRGDKWLTMFKSYVAAFLNVEIGNCRPYCDSYYGILDLDDAYKWLVLFLNDRPVRANSEAWQYSHGEAIYWCLDDYNNGNLDGIPSRDEINMFKPYSD